MKKYVIWGGFDYAVRWEMDQDAIYRGIDYFVDTDTKLIGTTYLGKPIYSPGVLLEERENVFVLIGSIVFHTDIEFQLKDMGFREDIDYIWAIGFCGDEKCPRLWKHIEWNDRENNKANILSIEQGSEALERLRMITRLIDFSRFTTLVDLCAANGRIEEYLPPDISYIPVDYIRYSDKTVVCDFNKGEFPEISEKPDKVCFMIAGALQYIKNWRWLLREISDRCDSFVCTHNDFVRVNREYRRTSYTHNNAIFNHQIILEMQSLGFYLAEAYDFRLRSVIMRFERGK